MNPSARPSSGHAIVLSWPLTAAGRLALALAQQSHPDLMLLDLSLPEISGWAAVEQLRQLGGSRRTSIMAVTAHVSADEIEQAARCTLHPGEPIDQSLLSRADSCAMETWEVPP